MNYKCENEVLTIFCNGRIDTANAGNVEEEITNIRNSCAHDKTVLDLNDVEYVSSSGLRVVLRLQKAEKNLSVINVNSEVYEIFEMTGFTEMMDIKKAYRKISVEGCEVIGQGANGKVYRVSEDTIVKVYLNPDSLDDIKRERDLAKKAFVLGIPTAISYDIARIGDGYGTVFELLSAKSFAKILSQEPERIDELVDLYVDLLKKIHSTTVKRGDMPDMKEVALEWAKFDKDHLPAETGEKLYNLVSQIPESDNMLHGDYHIKNVLLQSGEVLLIDMDTLCVGDPVFEFGSIYNAYVGFSVLNHDNILDFLGISFELAGEFWKKTLEKYFGTNDERVISAIEDKSKVIGYMRLMRRLIRRGQEDSKECVFYKSELERLLKTVDSLTF